MPPANQVKAEGNQLRLMLLGEALLRKTDWIGGIAEYGFNVIYVDGDGNPQRLLSRPANVLERVFIIDATDTPQTQSMGFVCTAIAKGDGFAWDEDAKALLPLNMARSVNKKNNKIIFDPSKLTYNDVIVFDSWTSLVRSLQSRYAKEEGIDISASTIMDGDWKDYRWTGAIASFIAEQLKKLPCHSVVICHTERFEKKDEKGKVLSVKNKAVSTSRTHADTLPRNFTDALFFSMVGSNIYIDTQPNSEITAGSRSLKPTRGEWGNIQFNLFAEANGLKPTFEKCKAIEYIPGTKDEAVSIPEVTAPNPPAGVITQATASVSVPQTGIFGKKG